MLNNYVVFDLDIKQDNENPYEQGFFYCCTYTMSNECAGSVYNAIMNTNSNNGHSKRTQYSPERSG